MIIIQTRNDVNSNWDDSREISDKDESTAFNQTKHGLITAIDENGLGHVRLIKTISFDAEGNFAI